MAIHRDDISPELRQDPNGPLVRKVDVTIHPNNNLIMYFEVTTNVASRVFVEYDRPGVGSFRSDTTELLALTRSFSIVRLRPLATYCYQVVAIDEQGRRSRGVRGTFTTGPLPKTLKGDRFTVVEGRPTYPLTLIEHNSDDFAGIVALDQEAKVVWYYQSGGNGVGALVQDTSDWNLLYQSGAPGNRSSVISEITPLGELVSRSPDVCAISIPEGSIHLDRSGVHHEILAAVDGKVLYIARVIADPFNDRSRLQQADAIRQWDQNTAEDVLLWNSFESLPLDPSAALNPFTDRSVNSDRDATRFWPGCKGDLVTEDWTHTNSIHFGASGNVIMSIRHLNQVIAISPDFQRVVWRLGGPGSDFTSPTLQTASTISIRPERCPTVTLCCSTTGTLDPKARGGPVLKRAGAGSGL